jgi:hypothetical protein
VSRNHYQTTAKALILLLVLPALACQTLTASLNPSTPTPADTSTPIPTNTAPATATPDPQARQEYLEALSSALETWFIHFGTFSDVNDRISNEGFVIFEDEDFKREFATVLVEMDYAATALEELPEPTSDLVTLDGHIKVIAENTHTISDEFISALGGDETATQNYLDSLDNILAALDAFNQEAESLQQ